MRCGELKKLMMTVWASRKSFPDVCVGPEFWWIDFERRDTNGGRENEVLVLPLYLHCRNILDLR